MILDASETALGFFGFDRSAYSDFKKKKGRRKWYDELREQRTITFRLRLWNNKRQLMTAC